MIKDEWTRERAKRFYERVETVREGEGHTVQLDGRAVRTPLKRPFAVPSKALAEATGAEIIDVT